MSQLLFVAIVATICAVPLVEAFGQPQKYLFVSSPLNHRVGYYKIDEWQNYEGAQMRSLITTGLTFPMGLAVDQVRKKLYVGDPDLRKLVAYDISLRGDAIEVGPQQTIADKVETRWVTVDGVGNVFFSDEPKHRILKVSAKSLDKGSAVTEVVYDGASVSSVSAPGGIAVDNFMLYWANKQSGTEVGSVMKALQTPVGQNASLSVKSALATNAVKCYGLCLARQNIFYTDDVTNLYGVNRGGGESVIVSSAFTEPRGCAFDGDGTLYVADKSKNAVYSFPANQKELRPNTPVKKVVDFQGAYGTAVYIPV